GDARHRTTTPINRAPPAVPFTPGDPAENRCEEDRIVELRFDNHLADRVDQAPPAIFEKGNKAVLQPKADALSAYVYPSLSALRQARAAALGLRHDCVGDIAHDARTWLNCPSLIRQAYDAGRAGDRGECGIAAPASRGLESRFNEPTAVRSHKAAFAV